MVHAFFGDDMTAVREAAQKELRRLSKNALVTTVTAESWNVSLLPELTEGASLFGEAHVIVIDTVSEAGPDALEELLDRIDMLRESPHRFIVIERSLKADEKKRLLKAAAEVEEITKGKAERFNAFSMTDAFLAKDKKRLWLLLQEAWQEGLSNEEIIGVLFWQVKTLRLAERTSDAAEAGMKPFVYSKAKRALAAFPDGASAKLSAELISIYHDGHSGRVDIGPALEKWVLSL